MIKIKWKSIYYPIGDWVTEDGSKSYVSGNFKCKYNGDDLICIMRITRGGGGHGEPPITASIPSFINANTLELVSVDGFVEV